MTKTVITTIAFAALIIGCGEEGAKPGTPNPAQNVDNGTGNGTGTKTPGTKGITALLPLKVGNKWTYETEIDGASACIEGKNEMEIVRTHDVAGKEYFISQGSACLPNVTLYYRVDRNTIEMLGRGTFLKLPKKGESWKWTPGKLTWVERHDSFEVPAGKYNECWTLEFDNPLGPNSKDVYCPGVGMVQSEGQGYVSRLSKVNF